MDKPTALPNPDFTKLIEALQEYIDFVGSDDFHEDVDDDYENEIFETALEAVYGPNVWNWINEVIA